MQKCNSSNLNYIATYHCKECNKIYESKVTRCDNPNCRAWNSIILGKPQEIGKIVKLSDIETGNIERLLCNDERLNEWDECLMGGTIPGLSYLLGGEPGIGKSTIALQWLECMSKYGPTLYISGEEAGRHVNLRAQRLFSDNTIQFLEERQIEKICEQIKNTEPAFVVLDSAQILSIEGLRTGSIQCQTESLSNIIETIKLLNTTLLIISHVNKDGEIAGPKTLEHLVDVVLQFEGDRKQNLRILRALKNRFGEQRMGIFHIKENGLISVSGTDMLKIWDDNIPGRVATIALEDGRTIALEIQVMLGPPTNATPRRYSQGYPLNRLHMILAVLEKNGIKLSNREVYVNVVGGIQVSDSGIDVGLARALVDDTLDRPSDPSIVWIGEIGLKGEIIIPQAYDQRIRLASKMHLRCGLSMPNSIVNIIANRSG